MSSGEWKVKEVIRKEAKATKTPKKAELTSEAWMGLRYISVVVSGLREERSRTGAAPGSWEQRLEAMEDSVTAIADKLELWMVDEYTAKNYSLKFP